MSTLAEQRIALVAKHMASEITHDFDTTLSTFDHPRYELFGAGQVFDGAEAVLNYFKASRRSFPDQANEPILLRAMEDAVLAEFWLTGTHNGPIQTPQASLRHRQENPRAHGGCVRVCTWRRKDHLRARLLRFRHHSAPTH
jgi:hypothetical protein